MNSFSDYSFPLILVTLDQFCDKVPFLSTISNLVNLVQKIALDVILQINPKFAVNSYYYNYIDKKDYAKICTLLIPVLGQSCIFLASLFYVAQDFDPFEKEGGGLFADVKLTRLDEETTHALADVCLSNDIGNKISQRLKDNLLFLTHLVYFFHKEEDSSPSTETSCDQASVTGFLQQLGLAFSKAADLSGDIVNFLFESGNQTVLEEQYIATKNEIEATQSSFPGINPRLSDIFGLNV